VSDLPILPLWVTKYEGKCAHLTLEEDGAHTRLLRLCWQTPGCTIPSDPLWIARRMRVDMPTYDRVVAPILSEFFVVENGRWHSYRLLAEYQRVMRKTQARKHAGAKGGKAKALKSGQSTPSNAKILPEQTLSKTLPSTISISTVEKEEAKASSKKLNAKGSRLDPDWTLPDDWLTDASDIAFKAKQPLSKQEIRNEADKFRDYWHGRAGAAGRKLDWRATWRNWVRSCLDRRPGARSAAPNGHGSRANSKHGGGGLEDAYARRYMQPQNGNGVSDDAGRGHDVPPEGDVIDGNFSRLI
jgi:uncharacterized protein YdaU (DUF1376 family)